MKQLQHDLAMGVMREVMVELSGCVSYEKRLHVIHLLYHVTKAALVKYESLVDRREPWSQPSRN